MTKRSSDTFINVALGLMAGLGLLSLPLSLSFVFVSVDDTIVLAVGLVQPLIVSHFGNRVTFVEFNGIIRLCTAKAAIGVDRFTARRNAMVDSFRRPPSVGSVSSFGSIPGSASGSNGWCCSLSVLTSCDTGFRLSGQADGKSETKERGETNLITNHERTVILLHNNGWLEPPEPLISRITVARAFQPIIPCLLPSSLIN